MTIQLNSHDEIMHKLEPNSKSFYFIFSKPQNERSENLNFK